MNSTLSDRLKEAMKGPPKITGVALAKACKVAPPSVNGWLSGKSKTIEGSNLIAAAEFLKVNPKWLADGKGPKYPDESITSVHHVAETVVPYRRSTDCDEWTTEAIKLMQSLRPEQREGALAALRTHIQNLGPPRHGQTLSVAA